MVKPRSRSKASAVKESVQDTPYAVLTERDERAATKQPSTLSAKAFFGKDVPQPEPKKALMPLNWAAGTSWKRGGAAPDAKKQQRSNNSSAGPQPCRGPVDFMVEEAVQTALEAEPDLASNGEELRRMRSALRTEYTDRWAVMTVAERRAYNEQAAADKERFRMEMKAWREANKADGKGGKKKADDAASDLEKGDDDVGEEDADDDGTEAKPGVDKAAAAPKEKMSRKKAAEAPAVKGNDAGVVQDDHVAAGGSDAGARAKPTRQKKASSKAEAAVGDNKVVKVSRAPLRWAERQRKELLGEGMDMDSNANEDGDGGTDAAEEEPIAVGSKRRAASGRQAAAISKKMMKGDTAPAVVAADEELVDATKKCRGAKNSTKMDQAGRAPTKLSAQQRRKMVEEEEEENEDVDSEDSEEEGVPEDSDEDGDDENEDVIVPTSDVEDEKPVPPKKQQQPKRTATKKAAARLDKASVKPKKAAAVKKVVASKKGPVAEAQHRGEGDVKDPWQIESETEEQDLKQKNAKEASVAPRRRGRPPSKAAAAAAQEAAAPGPALGRKSRRKGEEEEKEEEQPVDTKRPQDAKAKVDAELAPKRGRKIAKEAAPTPHADPEPAKPVAAPVAPVHTGGGKSASLKRKGRSIAVRAVKATAATDKEQDAADAAPEKDKMDESPALKQKRQMLAGKGEKRGRPAKRTAEAVAAEVPAAVQEDGKGEEEEAPSVKVTKRRGGKGKTDNQEGPKVGRPRRSK
ncbi:hypothetical protein Vretimale_6189 [Volvox reticuliferus]|uniref:HMG box domain-containing protein n=1 Tax=Volvox reticuliferus TaxID=1737510 RepID=A0A8J4G719_9CHLO|nr:hypothetical protein Vretifemale_7986 [Volvox reticuliferus]GIM01356.1 hypothetical protein Vretimale_6189 [Volvox reticuliferus]